jgi:hypothetical protein
MRLAEGELTANKLSRSSVLGFAFCMHFLAGKYLQMVHALLCGSAENTENKRGNSMKDLLGDSD